MVGISIEIPYHLICCCSFVFVFAFIWKYKKLYNGEVNGKRNNRQLYLMEHDTTMHDLDI